MKHMAVCIMLCLCLLLSACGSSVTQEPVQTELYTDSTGRTVEIPTEIKTIAVTGPLSQIYILPLAGDMLVGVSNAYTEDAAPYLPKYIFEKIEIGQLYGGKGEMNLEALLAAAPDIVLDIGEPKSSTAADLTALTEQTGIPFLHIDATVSTAGETYRILGQLLNREEKASTLAGWCESVYENMTKLMERVDADNTRKSILYCLGDKGVNVIAKGSFHGETIEMMGTNLAQLEEVVSSGAGNEVDMEQILLWDPQVLIFSPDSCYDSVFTSPQWETLQAVKSGCVYQTPAEPYGWLSSPPAVQRYLGMLWLGAVLYPEYAEYDLQEAVTEYYALFYDCTLTDEMYHSLTENAQ